MVRTWNPGAMRQQLFISDQLFSFVLDADFIVSTLFRNVELLNIVGVSLAPNGRGAVCKNHEASQTRKK